ncbi:hypothetical protein E1182_06675 [Micromonospora sp. KC721]|nr:hypothetical protein E1182_06675 [Micromonospora sp. KC721]
MLNVDATAAYRDDERWGFHLANEMARRLRASFGADEVTRMLERAAVFAPPEGLHFVYEENVRLFAGRRGRGPLHVAWDTSPLIDYFTCGHRLWADDNVVNLVSGEDYATDLESLQLVLALWAVRDIRFIMLAASVDDAKKTCPRSVVGSGCLPSRSSPPRYTSWDGGTWRSAPPAKCC